MWHQQVLGSLNKYADLQAQNQDAVSLKDTTVPAVDYNPWMRRVHDFFWSLKLCSKNMYTSFFTSASFVVSELSQTPWILPPFVIILLPCAVFSSKDCPGGSMFSQG